MEAMVVGIVLALVGGLGYLLKEEFEKRKNAERIVYERRYSAYSEFTYAVFDFYNAGIKGNSTKKEGELFQKALQKAQTDFLILASDEVYIAFKEMLKVSYIGNAETHTMFHALYDLMIKIRRDIGYPDTKITPFDALETLVKDLETSDDGKEMKKKMLLLSRDQ